MFIIQRIDDGKYVTPSGSFSSYTGSRLNARQYDTREAAEADACENERVIELR